MHTLTIDDNERTLLIETLDACLAELPHEAHHTDNRAYRDMLEKKQNAVQQLLRKLSTDQVIQRHGRFALVERESGFAWTMTSDEGRLWYWHPQSNQWTARPITSPSQKAAGVGFDMDAAHAQVTPSAAAATCAKVNSGQFSALKMKESVTTANSSETTATDSAD